MWVEGEMVRRHHEAWLNWALTHDRGLPEIPRRRVSEGGFAGLVSTEDGRRIATGWWEWAFERVDVRAGRAGKWLERLRRLRVVGRLGR